MLEILSLFNVTLEYFGKSGSVFLEVVSIFPSLVLVKKNTAKGKVAFQGKFVVIVEGFAR